MNSIYLAFYSRVRISLRYLQSVLFKTPLSALAVDMKDCQSRLIQFGMRSKNASFYCIQSNSIAQAFKAGCHHVLSAECSIMIFFSLYRRCSRRCCRPGSLKVIKSIYSCDGTSLYYWRHDASYR